MTDFFADLEAELLGAARRRAEGRPRRPRPRLAPMAALAASLAAVAIVSVLLLPRASEPRRAVSPSPPARLAPRSETVISVLNGTTQPGLAARTADKLVAAGYPGDGRVDTWPEQTVQHSRVLHVEGSSGEARGVAARLGIDRVRQASATELSAGGAQVIVVLGADRLPEDAVPAGRAVGVEARIVVADAGRGPSRERRLGLRVRDQLRSAHYQDVRQFVRPAEDTQHRSTIGYGSGARGVAERIGSFLGIDAIGPARMPEGTDVKIVIGSAYVRTR